MNLKCCNISIFYYSQLKNQLRQKSKDYTREKTSADCEMWVYSAGHYTP